MTRTHYFIIFATAIIAAAIALIMFQGGQSFGGAFTGTISQIDSATTTTVGPDTVVTIFSKGTECDARVISTLGTSAIMLSFGTVAGFTPTASAGHLQAASTTVVYDGELYGCGNVTAYAWASTSITVSEF